MTKFTRRQFHKRSGQLLAASLLGTAVSPLSDVWGAEPRPHQLIPQQLTLGFSSYALPGKSPVEAVSLVHQSGYDSIELCVFPPQGLPSASEEIELLSRLDATGLQLRSLLENLNPLSSPKPFEESLNRLKKACEFANRLPQLPVIQTVLGGKDWDSQKTLLRDRVGAWQKIAAEAKVVLAIKPHRGSALSRPDQAKWLITQLGNSPWLRMCFDYSHFIYRDMPLAESIAESLPVTAHVAVKDALQLESGEVQFKSPGEVGSIDYAALIKQFHAGGYQGDICVEVSSHVWRQPDYRPEETVKQCYAVLSQAFQDAGVSRP